MKRSQLPDRNSRVAQYLTTPIKQSDSKRPVYPTLDDAATVFGLHSQHISRIKRVCVETDPVTGERKIKNVPPMP